VTDSGIEIRELLTEIRDLLLPVADAYRDEYEKRLAEREAARVRELKELLRNRKRSEAWKLSDGTRSQAGIAKQVGMDAGDASRFFKRLRDLKAITAASKPTRAVEVKDA
jgi:hypothetical protein